MKVLHQSDQSDIKEIKELKTADRGKQAAFIYYKKALLVMQPLHETYFREMKQTGVIIKRVSFLGKKQGR